MKILMFVAATDATHELVSEYDYDPPEVGYRIWPADDQHGGDSVSNAESDELGNVTIYVTHPQDSKSCLYIVFTKADWTKILDDILANR